MQRLLIPTALVALGVAIIAFAFLISDQHNELLASRGMTPRPMRALRLVSRDLTAKAATVGVNPARLQKTIQFRIFLIGAVGFVTAASGVAVPLVFPRQLDHNGIA